MSKLDDLLPKKYKGHKWELSDIFDRNGKNNAAYLYAVEKCNEIRRDFDPLDPILKEKFMEMAGINYPSFNEGELSKIIEKMSECYRFSSNPDFDGYKVILKKERIESLKKLVRSIKKAVSKYNCLTAVDNIDDKKKQLVMASNELKNLKTKNNELLHSWEKEFKEESILLRNNNDNFVWLVDRLLKIQKALDAISDATGKMNIAQKELVRYGFISVTNPRHPKLKSIEINYDNIRLSFPRIKKVYVLEYNENYKKDKKTQKFQYVTYEKVFKQDKSGLTVAVYLKSVPDSPKPKDLNFDATIKEYVNKLEKWLENNKTSEFGNPDDYKVGVSLGLASRIYVSKDIFDLEKIERERKERMDAALEIDNERLKNGSIKPSEVNSSKQIMKKRLKETQDQVLMQREFRPWREVFMHFWAEKEELSMIQGNSNVDLNKILSAKTIEGEVLSLQELAKKYVPEANKDADSDSLCYIPRLVYDAVNHLFDEDDKEFENAFNLERT